MLVCFASSGSTTGRSINYRSYVFGVKSSCSMASVESRIEKTLVLVLTVVIAQSVKPHSTEFKIKGSNSAVACHWEETA
jgi:hypothetical protein